MQLADMHESISFPIAYSTQTHPCVRELDNSLCPTTREWKRRLAIENYCFDCDENDIQLEKSSNHVANEKCEDAS
jgi:hypothetical protein